MVSIFDAVIESNLKSIDFTINNSLLTIYEGENRFENIGAFQLASAKKLIDAHFNEC